MLSEMKSVVFALSAFTGLALVCPSHDAAAARAIRLGSPVLATVLDTAIVRLKITGMT